MGKRSNTLALELLAFAIGFLVVGLVSGRFACMAAVQCMDMNTREASLAFTFTLFFVPASFLLSVSVSFFLAWYLISRERKKTTKLTESPLDDEKDSGHCPGPATIGA